MNEDKAREYAERAIEKLRSQSRTPCLEVGLTDTKPSLFESKVGGIPYLPSCSEIPTDSSGKQMRLLAQVNCKDLIQLEDHPHNGILQFWLTVNSEWNEYSVKYYTDINEESALSSCQCHPEETAGAFPVKGEYGMSFNLKEETMSRDDIRLEAFFCQCYTEISGEYISSPEDAGDVVYEIFEGYCDDCVGCGSKIGGYEWSTQPPSYATYQPKEYANPYRSPWKTYIEEIDMSSDDTTILLFQLSSHYKNSSDYKVLWGDAGIGRFYIKRKDLKNRDFSKVWFSWDCS